MQNDLLKFKKIVELGDNIFKRRFVLKGSAFNGDASITHGMDYKCDGMELLIELDEEDVEYFKNKYLPKIDDEMNEKINKIIKEYGYTASEINGR